MVRPHRRQRLHAGSTAPRDLGPAALCAPLLRSAAGSVQVRCRSLFRTRLGYGPRPGESACMDYLPPLRTGALHPGKYGPSGKLSGQSGPEAASWPEPRVCLTVRFRSGSCEFRPMSALRVAIGNLSSGGTRSWPVPLIFWLDIAKGSHCETRIYDSLTRAARMSDPGAISAELASQLAEQRAALADVEALLAADPSQELEQVMVI